MIGIIVTGHGSFATGITSGLSLLAGKLEQYEAVDFVPEDSVDTLTEKLAKAVERLAGCSGILIYTDLTGGSPFNVSIRIKMERPEKLEVLGGSNLPAVLDGYMSRMVCDEVTELAGRALEAGKNAMVLFAPSLDDDEEYEE